MALTGESPGISVKKNLQTSPMGGVGWGLLQPALISAQPDASPSAPPPTPGDAAFPCWPVPEENVK